MTSREQQALLDILIAAEDAMAFVRDVSWETFPANTLVRRGVLNCLTEIGEAAGRIEAAAELARPDLPWRKMKDLRNVIVHQYEGVNLPIIWRIVTEEARSCCRAQSLVPGAPETIMSPLHY